MRCSTLFTLALGVFPAISSGQSEWTIRETWEFSVGIESSPDHDLHLVADATLFDDGRLAVLNGGTSEIFIYTAPGRLVRVIGRSGDGPGEYRRPASMRRDAEGGLWVYDPGNSRTTRLDASLHVIETRRTVYSFGSGRLIASLRPLGTGSVPLVQGTIPLMEIRHVEGVFYPTWNLLLTDAGAPAELTQLSGGQEFWTGLENGVRLYDRVPFGESALYGSGMTSLVVGSTHSTVFRLLDPAGFYTAEVQARGETRRVTSRDWQLLKDEFRSKHTGVLIRGMRTNPAAAVESFLSNSPRGRDFPLFDEVTMDELDRIWVREYSLEGPTRRWQVLSPTAGVIAYLDVPREWHVLEFGDGYIVALTTDAMDVELVRVHRVMESSAGA